MSLAHWELSPDNRLELVENVSCSTKPTVILYVRLPVFTSWGIYVYVLRPQYATVWGDGFRDRKVIAQYTVTTSTIMYPSYWACVADGEHCQEPAICSYMKSSSFSIIYFSLASAAFILLPESATIQVNGNTKRGYNHTPSKQRGRNSAHGTVRLYSRARPYPLAVPQIPGSKSRRIKSWQQQYKLGCSCKSGQAYC